ncbi:hypothetical protein M2132_001702 [Dysgonomonas sp. PH5-45]|uniref:fimbrillin family protein n=1 Tax=unclassified Dysgonomonas TaxID=2630389 RepID=UPI002476EB64|nr:MULTISPECIES: fimbrillin family protein [unclassified Dysgonomonas]MDH6355361.1 hypothetical protein [Dysgonomonas sp. PH5-45]MDH6388259.1 hypothetical protein [Dysgonomonas sp. PH5-37]
MERNNKLKIGRWAAVLFFLSVLFFAGCSDEDTATGNGTGTNAIAFDCSTSSLRAAKTTIDDMQYFRVSALWNKGDGVYYSFMDNQLVEKQGNSWVYSPIKYWPGYGSVSFFAYTPAISSGLDVLHIENDINQVSIEYTVSTNHQEQEDFMVATSLDKTANPIQLDFKHALSVVNFQACSNNPGVEYRIKKITLVGLCNQGILTGIDNEATSIWSWYGQSGTRDYTVYQKYPIETDGSTYREIGSLMVLPQPQEPDVADFNITVNYDMIEGTSVTTGEDSYTLPDFVFQMGKRYTFYLDLSAPSSPSPSQKRSVGTASAEIKWRIVSELNEE